MNRIQTDVTISAREFDFDNRKVVNVVKILSNAFFGEFGTAPANDQIAGGSLGYLPSNMAWQYKLAVTPLDVNLHIQSVENLQAHTSHTDSLACS